MDLGVQCFLQELTGGKGHLPGLQFLPSNPFSIIAVTLTVLGPVCLLPVYKKKKKLCLKFNFLHYGLDTEQIKVSFTESCLLPHSWEGFSLGGERKPITPHQGSTPPASSGVLVWECLHPERQCCGISWRQAAAQEKPGTQEMNLYLKTQWVAFPGLASPSPCSANPQQE